VDDYDSHLKIESPDAQPLPYRYNPEQSPILVVMKEQSPDKGSQYNSRIRKSRKERIHGSGNNGSGFTNTIIQQEINLTSVMDIPAPPQIKQSPYLLPLQMGSYEKMKRRDYDLRQ
jgi:hypothetical protein